MSLSCFSSVSAESIGTDFMGRTPITGVVFSTPFSSTTGTSSNLPITFGHVFRQGDVPSGTLPRIIVSSGYVLTQVDPKVYYPDGSIKHAILSTIVPVVTNSGVVYGIEAAYTS